jgi:hypothetical protein
MPSTKSAACVQILNEKSMDGRPPRMIVEGNRTDSDAIQQEQGIALYQIIS